MMFKIKAKRSEKKREGKKGKAFKSMFGWRVL
jgi:hypothetical protein